MLLVSSSCFGVAYVNSCGSICIIFVCVVKYCLFVFILYFSFRCFEGRVALRKMLCLLSAVLPFDVKL